MAQLPRGAAYEQAKQNIIQCINEKFQEPYFLYPHEILSILNPLFDELQQLEQQQAKKEQEEYEKAVEAEKQAEAEEENTTEEEAE